MRAIIIFILLTACSDVCASKESVCFLEKYFENTEPYKSSLLDDKEKKLELDRKELSLLPDIYVGAGQYSSNDRSFKSIKESSLNVGFSQSIYEGGSFNKNRNKINLDLEYNDLMVNDKRNNYLINLYRDIIEYKYKLDLRELYNSQLKNQRVQLEAAKANLMSGNIAEIEFDAASLRSDELINKINQINNEIQQSVLDIYTNYNVPSHDLENINNDIVLSCKKESAEYILKKSRELLYRRERVNHELEMTAIQPHANLSVYISPPETGAWKDLTLKKSDFGASVNVTIPISGFFSINSIERSYAIAVSRINNTYDEKNNFYLREKEKTKIKLNQLKEDLNLSKKIVELRGREMEYIFSRFKDKKENIISYYRQVDEYELAKINMKREEREIEFNEVYLHILD